ncbi:unnamed protein product [Peronospora belbahrii]|uniref:Uncharacterized protein n=1 Tax=Peronospora belbahrii TaxID=622444 RepID=A0ABN8CTM3_9STRA|nr:unnamed protein product [Peronospora belbahrii]
MKKATILVVKCRQAMKEVEELPTKYQWIPLVIWRIYDQVMEIMENNNECKSLKTAMHDMMKVLKETNPFFYLQELYQPPPRHLDEQWDLIASEKLMTTSSSMAPYFQKLKSQSFALFKKNDSSVRINYGWNQLRETLAFV